MPIDGHAYLVQQGWGGKGTGLRHGAISRPVIIAQKKTLAGVGKDRDEAFPFWDHVFEAAAMSIQVKVSKDDDDSDSETNLTPAVELQRTKTGIISNRRPETGTPALSGATTPESQMSGSGSSTPRLSLMAVAKQEAARRMLYANFFRGPVLGPSNDEATPPESPPASVVSGQPTADKTIPAPTKKTQKGKERAMELPSEDVDSVQQKKRKNRSASKDAEDTARKERRQRERDEKKVVEEAEVTECMRKKRRKLDEEATSVEEREIRDRKAEKAERKRRKAKRAAKEERRKLRETAASTVSANCGGDAGGSSNEHMEQSRGDPAYSTQDALRNCKKEKVPPTGEEREKKKKRHKTSS